MSLLSLVFICRENPRRSGILPFPDCPRFCPLKTRNRIYRLGWTETNLENRERFYFSDTSQISAMVGDHSQQMKTETCTVGDVGDGFRSLPCNPLNLWDPVSLSYICVQHTNFNFWRTFHSFPPSSISGVSGTDFWRFRSDQYRQI